MSSDSHKCFKQKFWLIAAVFLILASFTLNVTSALRESQTTDEGVHIAAGYSYWLTNDFKINPEHPPLLKLLATLPLLITKPNFPLNSQAWQTEDEWGLAKEFLYDSGNNADLILFLTRLPIILLSVLLGIFIFYWASKLFGRLAGVLALALFAFDPNFLAHGHYLTTDLGLSLFFILCLFYFNRYLEKPKTKNALLFSVFLALALLAKFSAILLIIVLPVLYLLKRWQANKTDKKKYNLGKFIWLVVLAMIVFSIFAFLIYGLELKTPINDQEVQKILADGQLPDNQITQKIYHSPIPFFSYFKGLILVQQHSKWGHYSYLLGQFDEHGGWWYYFPIAFLVKTPLATLILILAALIIYLKKFIFVARQNKAETKKSKSWEKLVNLYKRIPFVYYLLVVPPLIYFISSLTSNLNLGVRHLLPIYPFIFILIAGAIARLKFKKPCFNFIFKSAIALILAIYFLISLSSWPHYLSYFSEAIGGAKCGHKYLSDSNLDWGQDLKNLKLYVEKNNLEEIYALVSGWAGPEYYHIPTKALPNDQQIKELPNFSGYVAISISYLMQEKPNYSWLYNYQPIDNIGYSIYIYKIE